MSRKKKLSKDTLAYVKTLEKHIPKVDPIYGLEGYVHDICLAADIRRGRPVVCESPDCYSTSIPFRFNNPYGKTTEEICENRIEHFRCSKCGRVYLAHEEDSRHKTRNRAKGTKQLISIGTAIAVVTGSLKINE